MPWKKTKGGYTTAEGGFSKNPKQYEKLKASGMPKSEAAAISNEPKKSKGKKRG